MEYSFVRLLGIDFVRIFGQVKEQFLNENKLRQIKILVIGPPCSGKKFVSDFIAKEMGLLVVEQS